jgi:DNA-binding NarL/FixJ family response regulator
VKSESDLSERIKQNGEEKPSLIIFDLNSNSVKPLSLIPKLKSKLKKTSVIGFLSHVQGDLKQKAHEVGCDMVLPRSAFSQNLPQLLRRHGAADDETIQ